MINIIIVDDQSLMRDGLSVILSAASDINVLSCGKNGYEAVSLTEKYCPDIVLMDIRMPEMDGVCASKIIIQRFPKVKVLLLTTFDDEELIINAVRAGISGYVFKDIEKDKLIAAIKDCYNGTFIMPGKVASVLARRISDTNYKNDDSLQHVETHNTNNIKKLDFSERELEIAHMIAQGFTNHQIASALYISDGTVKNYVSSIYGKTGIKDRTKLALFLKQNET